MVTSLDRAARSISRTDCVPNPQSVRTQSGQRRRTSGRRGVEQAASLSLLVHIHASLPYSLSAAIQEARHMMSENACFDWSVVIRFDFADDEPLYALVGLDCWNVSFEGAADAQSPEGGYLLPDKLVELGMVCSDVDPNVDVSDLGE